jgi:hypothetical protein
MANEHGSNGSRLAWWVMGVGGSVAVLLFSFAVHKMDGIDHRLRAVEVLQGEAKEHIRQLHVLIDEMRADQVARARTFGEIHATLSTLAVRLHAVEEALEVPSPEREGR